jgi:arsenite methyltransferase
MMQSNLDQWAQWLLHRRHGGDPEELKRTLEFLHPIRDRVLDNANLSEGATLLDVGCGDGLIAFGALERVRAMGTVIFSDISQDLLDHDAALAEQMGVYHRCRFARAAAEDLSEIPDASVDAVATRSVLIYVADKASALREFHRVLRPGGRLSAFEPINRFGMGQTSFDRGPVQELHERIKAIYERIQPADSDPMVDFDERNLLALTEAAGFADIYLELNAEITPAAPRRWETVLHSSGNPKDPTLAEAMRETLTPDEAERYTAYLRPRVEEGHGTNRWATAYLWAVKH